MRFDLRTSGDTAGPRDRVVGYGAWDFTAGGAAQLTEAERSHLIAIARHAIAAALGLATQAPPASVPAALQTWRPCFVSLYGGDGGLPGCSSEDRRGGKGGVRTGGSWGARVPLK